MFNGKMKAVTFSYDDGVTQDIRLVEILNKYNLKCTFNINSGKLGINQNIVREDVEITHNKIKVEDIKSVYEGHEVAAHTICHPCLTILNDWAVIKEVEEDRLRLSDIVGYEVVGMAYPGGGGGPIYNDRVGKIVKENTGIKYARVVSPSYGFDLQENLYEFKPTIHHHNNWDKLFELGQKFIDMKTDIPQIFYIWGHAYEFDIYNDYDRFEEFCKFISGKDDIFYGTNKEILLK